MSWTMEWGYKYEIFLNVTTNKTLENTMLLNILNQIIINNNCHCTITMRK